MEIRRFAGVVAVHADRVALVREHRDDWGGDFWNLPSGALEAGERPERGAARELAEETGLVVDARQLRLVSTSSTTSGKSQALAWNFTVAVEEPEIAVADPDGLILEARWFPRLEAIRLLDRLPYRPLREPAVDFLGVGRGTGRHWRYDAPGSTPVLEPLALGAPVEG